MATDACLNYTPAKASPSTWRKILLKKEWDLKTLFSFALVMASEIKRLHETPSTNGFFEDDIEELIELGAATIKF